ncbi:hypothetical protein GGI04_000652 [Coemansia thaxteri]|nr:hypothetical protein GGI04_000652 [Coemansia thaxteri]
MKGLFLLLLAGTCAGDIVLSVAPPQNMDAYLGVLSQAWPTIYPLLEGQLEIAQQQVPAEYSHLLSLLQVTAVPSTYDAAWASLVVSNAVRIGPTTILAQDVDGADTEPAMLPTDVVTTNGLGQVATITAAPMERPTIVVAINGNAVRDTDAGSSSAGSSSSSGSSPALGSSSSSSGSSSSSTSSSSSAGTQSSDANALRLSTLAAMLTLAASTLSLL